jgi:SAM-dependent methyltransferase
MAWMRRESLLTIEDTFPSGACLLEIGCGSGEEAVSLAGLGYRVLATDISPEMAALTGAKARTAGLADRVRAVAIPAGQLAALRPPEPFDGAYASFGGLNCEPRLKPTAAALRDLIRPRGHFVCSVMSRVCLFEIVWFLLHGRPRSAFRRLRRGWQRAPVAGQDSLEETVMVRYLSPRDIALAFAHSFVIKRMVALPLLLPPPYLDALYRHHPRFFGAAERWDRQLREHRPFRACGDHTLLVMQRL